MAVTRNDIKNAALEAGVTAGDILLVHSSFKSMGEIDGGAETVVTGLMDAIGEDGTLVFPTFCQKDFVNTYKTWHLDKESDVGYLTNYFRKREGSIRSDQATHSVAAAGKDAKWLTETHGHTHKRYGNFGDTPFSADSPWEKMYQKNAKVLLLGVQPSSITFRHYAEYVFIEECLKNLEGHAEYDDMKGRLLKFGPFLDPMEPWPHVFNMWVVEQLEAMGLIKTSTCGNATFTVFESKPFIDYVLFCLRNDVRGALWDLPGPWHVADWIKWYDDYKAIVGK